MNHFLHSSRRAVLRLGATIALSLGSALWLAAAQAGEPAPFAAAFADFQRANGGDESAIEPAAERFAALAAAAPGNPVLLAYSGAAVAMRARTTRLPWKKMSHAEDGLAHIDKALSLLDAGHDAPMFRGVPASLETRFTAAGTFLAMPGMFNRGARGAKLLDEVLASPLLANAPLPFRGAVWLRAGALAADDRRPDDARRWLQQVVSSGAPQAAAAQARLKELS